MDVNKNHEAFVSICKNVLPLFVTNYLRNLRNNILFSISRIKNQGFFKVSRELITRYISNTCAIFFSIPIVVIILILNPIVKLRLVRLLSERIGHFALNTEILLCLFDERLLSRRGANDDIRYFFYTHRTISNKQLLKMWKRILPVLSFPVVCGQVDKILSLLSVQYRNDVVKKTIENGELASDKLRLFERVPRGHVFFTFEEEKRGQVLMEKLGVPHGGQYVCLVVRDALYLEKLCPGYNWQYHDFRNADVMSYKKAALYLAEKGYIVIRMGKWVADKFDVSHPRIIDYANHSLRCDFLDIYLPSKCDFFMSTSTGLDGVAQLFRRPMLFSNIGLPSELQMHLKNSLFIPKKIKNRKTMKMLSFNEIHEIISFNERVIPEFFIKNDLELIDNTENEITALVQEMEKRLNNDWDQAEIDCGLQKQFLKEYCIRSVTNIDEVKVIVGSEFLKKYNLLCDAPVGATNHD